MSRVLLGGDAILPIEKKNTLRQRKLRCNARDPDPPIANKD
jgi:hypothetical protein